LILVAMSINKVHDEMMDNMASGKMPYLTIKCLTWFRDSYGLFDYDSPKVTESKVTFYDSVHLNREYDD